MTKKQADRKEAIESLRESLKPGDTVYTVLRHVSRSGMSRTISAHILRIDNSAVDMDALDRGESPSNLIRPLWLSYNVAKAIEAPHDDRREGVKMAGCGMDMGFALVYGLSSVLWSDGFDCTGENCPANDHVNGDKPPKGSCPDGTGPRRECENLMHGQPQAMKDKRGGCTPWKHKDGGYALKHRWL